MNKKEKVGITKFDIKGGVEIPLQRLWMKIENFKPAFQIRYLILFEPQFYRIARSLFVPSFFCLVYFGKFGKRELLIYLSIYLF